MRDAILSTQLSGFHMPLFTVTLAYCAILDIVLILSQFRTSTHQIRVILNYKSAYSAASFSLSPRVG